jgi:hypothetical protein
MLDMINLKFFFDIQEYVLLGKVVFESRLRLEVYVWELYA